MLMGKIMLEAMGLMERCQTKPSLGVRTVLCRGKDGRFVYQAARIQILPQSQRQRQRQRRPHRQPQRLYRRCLRAPLVKTTHRISTAMQGSSTGLTVGHLQKKRFAAPAGFASKGTNVRAKSFAGEVTKQILWKQHLRFESVPVDICLMSFCSSGPIYKNV